jgi:hypothetical protein
MKTFTAVTKCSSEGEIILKRACFRMKICLKPRNIYSAVKPLYILSKLLGLTQLRSETATVTPENFKSSVGVVSWTVGNTLYSVIILFILMTFHCLSLHIKIQNIYRKLKYTYILTDSFNSVLTLATVFVSIIQGITFNRNKVDMIFTKINNNDKSILRNSASDVYKRTNRIFILHITVIALIFGFVCIYDLFSNFKKNTIIAVTRYSSHVIRIVMDMQFVSFNLLLKSRFDIFNKQLLSIFGIHSERELEQHLLDNICRESTYESTKLPDHKGLSFKRRLDTFYGEYYELGGKSVWKVSPLTERRYFGSTNSGTSATLQKLRINHNEICNTARLVVSTYGVYITFELINISADIIIVLYFSTDFLISDSYMNIEAISWCSFWLVLHAAKLISITRSCQLVSNSGNHTSILVGKLMLLTLPFSSNTLTQLKMFYYQLLHTKLHMTACDFFELNNKILGSVAKMAVTYVIVLLLSQKI